MTNTIQKSDIRFTSAYFRHGLASVGLLAGVREEHVDSYASMVLSRARDMILADPKTQVSWTTESGKTGSKTIDQKDAKAKLSGAGVTTKLTVGQTHAVFIGESIGADLAFIDQDMTKAEKGGRGYNWSPVAGSGIERFLLRTAAEFKAQRPEHYPAPVAVDTTPVSIQPMVNA